MKELTYTKSGDYYIPNLSYPETKATYGKYGMMREDYLKEHRTGLWNSLMLQGSLTAHLNEMDRAARERIELMMPELMKASGVTDELKASDPMQWVGLMNFCKTQAEEMILDELVYN